MWYDKWLVPSVHSNTYRIQHVHWALRLEGTAGRLLLELVAGLAEPDPSGDLFPAPVWCQ